MSVSFWRVVYVKHHLGCMARCVVPENNRRQNSSPRRYVAIERDSKCLTDVSAKFTTRDPGHSCGQFSVRGDLAASWLLQVNGVVGFYPHHPIHGKVVLSASYRHECVDVAASPRSQL